VRLADLSKRYQAQVEFVTIYIREAHPVDGWWLGGGLPGLALKAARWRAATDVYDPQSMQERQGVANRFCRDLEYQMRVVVDRMDDPVNTTYAAAPTRLYLVGIDGKIDYAGAPGPLGFSPAQLGRAVESTLAASREANTWEYHSN